MDTSDKRYITEEIEDKKKKLTSISYVFETFFSSSCIDSQPYTKGIIEFELKTRFESLFNRKQKAEERWPNSEYILNTFNAPLFMGDDAYHLDISNITINHPYTQAVAKLPIALAWLSIYGNNLNDEESRLTDSLLSRPLIIYNVKQFAPSWFKESYHLLVCWFSYCKNKQK